MIYTKGLPYGIFMRQIIKDMNEKGQLHQLTKKWEWNQPDCQPVHRKGTPISFGKLTTLFLEIALGVLLTLIILFAEKIHSIYRPVNQHHQSVLNINHGHSDAMKIILKDMKEVLQRRNIDNVELNLLIKKTENKLKQ